MNTLIIKLKILLLRTAPYWILLLTFAVFLPTVNYEFLDSMDDGYYVLSNRHLAFSWANIIENAKSVLGLWTPLPMLTYMIDYAIGGFNVYSYHLQNICWHLIAVSMVWVLLRKLHVAPLVTVLGTLFFAIHPQRVESVVWIAERKDVVCAAFFFATLAAYFHHRAKGRHWDIWSLLLTAGALLCKPTAAALPAVIFLLEVYRSRKWDFRFLLKLWPYILTVMVYLLVNSALMKGAAGNLFRSFSPLDSLLLVSRNYLMFAGKTLLPLDLHPIYPYFYPVATTIISIIGIWLVIAFIFFRYGYRLRYRLLPFILIFLIVLLPTAGFIPFSNADFADRYSYIPSIFLLAPLLSLLRISKLRRCQVISALLVVIYAVYLTSFTLIYSQLWKNSQTVMAASCDTVKPNFRAAYVLALIKINEGALQEAVELTERAGFSKFQETRQTAAAVQMKHFIYGLARARSGNKNQAKFHLIKAADPFGIGNIKILKYDAIVTLFSELASLELQAGQPQSAAIFFEKIKEYYPEEPFQGFFYDGVAAMLRKNYPAAIQNFEAALKINPNDERCQNNLANARAKITQ